MNRSEESLEDRERRQKLYLEPIKAAATVIGIVLVLVGLGIDRLNAISEREFKKSQLVFERRIERMVEISDLVQNTCREPIELIKASEAALVFGVTEIEGFAEAVRGMALEDPGLILQREAVLQTADQLSAQLRSDLDEIGYWKDAVRLEAKWALLANQPTGDFPVLFSSAAVTLWQEVAALTMELLSQRFSIFGGGANVTSAAYIKACDRLINLVHSEIAAETRAFQTASQI